jgi:quercetin 2,3-dioxygenase
MERQVENVYSSPSIHWVGNGFRVQSLFPRPPLIDSSRLSPFFLLDYNPPHYFPPSSGSKGVGPHPHKGMETVTFVFSGQVEHTDSAGNRGVINSGGVQWMTAGSGLLHKEMHEEAFCRHGGYFHLAQMWINLPAKYKNTKPAYQSIDEAQMPVVHSPLGSKIRVLAGSYMEVPGPASTFSPIEIYIADIPAGAGFSAAIPEKYNAAALVIEGAVISAGADARACDLIVFENKGTGVFIKAVSGSKLLFFAGEPLNEPIAASGPFVMNSYAELEECYSLFESGKFGTLS